MDSSRRPLATLYHLAISKTPLFFFPFTTRGIFIHYVDEVSPMFISKWQTRIISCYLDHAKSSTFMGFEYNILLRKYFADFRTFSFKHVRYQIAFVSLYHVRSLSSSQQQLHHWIRAKHWICIDADTISFRGCFYSLFFINLLIWYIHIDVSANFDFSLLHLQLALIPCWFLGSLQMY